MTSRIPKYVQVGCMKRFATVGGAAYEDFACPGVTATSAILCGLNVEGASPVTIVKYDYQDTDTIRVTLSADPNDDHVLTLLWS